MGYIYFSPNFCTALGSISRDHYRLLSLLPIPIQEESCFLVCTDPVPKEHQVSSMEIRTKTASLAYSVASASPVCTQFLYFLKCEKQFFSQVLYATKITILRQWENSKYRSEYLTNLPLITKPAVTKLE